MNHEIISLADDPELVDTCAAWSFGMWGCQSGGSWAKARAAFAAASQPNRSLTTFLARRDGRPAGMASLRASDFAGRLDLTPWLASVYVHPEHRGQGLARALVRAVEDYAKGNGHSQLYLISERAETLYAELGWMTFDRVEGPHGPAVLMSRVLDET